VREAGLRWHILLLSLLLLLQSLQQLTSVSAFMITTPKPVTPVTSRKHYYYGGGGSRGVAAAASRRPNMPQQQQPRQRSRKTTTTTTCLRMYNLPPSPPNPQDELRGILQTVAVGVGLVAILASPLGAVIFAIFNSILVLSIALPILAVVAFQLWQYYYTVGGRCPQCGAPVRVLKQGRDEIDPTPSVCLNCGSLVQATADNQSVVLTPKTSTAEAAGSSAAAAAFWQDWLGGLGGGASNSNPDAPTVISTKSATPSSSSDNVRKQRNREQTVIDVQVEREDER